MYANSLSSRPVDFHAECQLRQSCPSLGVVDREMPSRSDHQLSAQVSRRGDKSVTRYNYTPTTRRRGVHSSQSGLYRLAHNYY